MEEENGNAAVVATQELPIAVREETGATDEPFLIAHLAFLRQETKTLEAKLVKKVRI